VVRFAERFNGVYKVFIWGKWLVAALALVVSMEGG
jgi:hypothetical protein